VSPPPQKKPLAGPLSKTFFFFKFLGAFEKFQKAIISLVMSVCLHGTTRLPLEGFSPNLIFEHVFENMPRKFKFD